MNAAPSAALRFMGAQVSFREQHLSSFKATMEPQNENPHTMSYSKPTIPLGLQSSGSQNEGLNPSDIPLFGDASQSSQVTPRNLLEAQQRQKLLPDWAQGLFPCYGGNSLESIIATLTRLEAHQRERPNTRLITQTPGRGHTCGLCNKDFPNRQKSTIHVFSYHWRLDNWSCVNWYVLLFFPYSTF